MGTSDHAFFYNSINKDRPYDAESFGHWLKKFFTTGVFNGDLQVTANGNMTVALSPGYVNIDGKVRFFQDTQLFTLDTADATYDRIDTIVIERNDTDRDITAKVVTGGISSNPAYTIPVRENGIHQLIVAQIYVTHGVVKILQENITDTRMDANLCGLVTGTVDEMDFSGFKAQFDDWFAHIKGILGEDEAGALLQMIESLTPADVGLGNVPNVATNDQTPTYTESATLENLTSGEKLSVAFGKLKKAVSSLISHIGNKNNPHEVTAAQVGAMPSAGDKVQAWTDNEGGNFKIISKDGTFGYEFDAFDNNCIRVHTYTHNPGHGGNALLWYPETGVVDGIGTPVADSHAANKSYVDSNFAPAGYGLGVTGIPPAPSADNTPGTGFFKIPSFGGFGSGNIDVMSIHHDDVWRTQLLFDQIDLLCGTHIGVRSMANNIWGEVEWVNPPMAIGVEYRTTERWDGKTVFAKLVNLGSGPSSTKKDVEVLSGGIDNCRVTGIGKYSGGQITIPNKDTALTMLSGTTLRIESVGDYSIYTIYATLYYTKT